MKKRAEYMRMIQRLRKTLRNKRGGILERAKSKILNKLMKIREIRCRWVLKLRRSPLVQKATTKFLVMNLREE